MNTHCKFSSLYVIATCVLKVVWIGYVTSIEHTIAAEDSYPLEVAVETDSDSSVRDHSDHEIVHLEDAAFISLL